jgi:ACR3 family arsenite transporter
VLGFEAANMSDTDTPSRTKEYPSTHDAENNIQPTENPEKKENVSAFKALGWLDRFLAVWILLAMVVGIILGNFVPSTGPALEKGKFVGVSVPIGKNTNSISSQERELILKHYSCWAARYDVSYPVQSPI